MSAEVVGVALVAIPILAIAAWVVAMIGWDGLLMVIGVLASALLLSGVITFGAYLIAEGWPS